MIMKLFLALTLVLPIQLTAQQTGSISGIIQSGSTREFLPLANIMVLGSVLGATSDIDGRYSIASVPIGAYSLSIS